mmetsp:Transcript_17166/g.26017  ORF Transcript_17166/g.26017 Transcript_17166/m.26017 type:complete len:87 (+) Transcript_17166:652-912(+)
MALVMPRIHVMTEKAWDATNGPPRLPCFEAKDQVEQRFVVEDVVEKRNRPMLLGPATADSNSRNSQESVETALRMKEMKMTTMGNK